MKSMLRVLIPLITIIIFVNLYFVHTGMINPVENYPVWMKDSAGNRTDQTSGLYFTGIRDGKKMFISADDIGRINRISVDESKNPPEFNLSEISFSKDVTDLFGKFKKRDMEDIFYDSSENKIYLAIEGHEYSSNDPMIYRKKEGIYELTFNKDIFTFDTILTIKRLQLPEEIYAHTFDNIGFEGFAMTKDFFFLGLENYQTPDNEFTDSTVIYVVNRNTNEVKAVGTSDLKISSVCGLYASDNYSLYGIDRNRRSVFKIMFDTVFNVTNVKIKQLNLTIPLHNEINSILGTAPESITFDYQNNFYVSVDPWKEIYKPDIAEKKKLSQEELDNFYKFVPIMYKFKNEF